MAKAKKARKSSKKTAKKGRKSPKRVAAGKKAAATRKRKHAIRSRAAKKAIKKRKRDAKGRLRNPAKGRKSAKRVAAGKKAARTRKAKAVVRVLAAKKGARVRKLRKAARAVGGKFRSLDHRVDTLEGKVSGLQRTVASHSKQLRSFGMTKGRKAKVVQLRALPSVQITPVSHQLAAGSRMNNPFARKHNKSHAYNTGY